jgi:hypothetical protein
LLSIWSLQVAVAVAGEYTCHQEAAVAALAVIVRQ